MKSASAASSSPSPHCKRSTRHQTVMDGWRPPQRRVLRAGHLSASGGSTPCLNLPQHPTSCRARSGRTGMLWRKLLRAYVYKCLCRCRGWAWLFVKAPSWSGVGLPVYTSPKKILEASLQPPGWVDVASRSLRFGQMAAAAAAAGIFRPVCNFRHDLLRQQMSINSLNNGKGKTLV